MKAFFLVKKTLLFLLCAVFGIQAFQDASSLTGRQRAARIVLRGIGASVGLVGIPVIDSSMKNYYRDDTQAACGVALCAAGFTGGYTAMDALATQLFARQNGVSYSVQKIALFYDINVEQYRAVLERAQTKNSTALCDALSVLLAQHCGANWQKELSEFLTHYRDFAAYLIGLKRSSLNERELLMLRMIEIGAALENLYFGSKPSKKQMVAQAAKLYQQIGIYDPFNTEEK